MSVTIRQVIDACRDAILRITSPAFKGIVTTAKPGARSVEVDAGSGLDWTADLAAADLEDGFYLVPKEGSQVTLIPIGRDGQRCAMVQASALEEVRLKMGAVKLRVIEGKVEIDSPKTVFNGGLLGGLVMIFKLLVKINLLETQVNALSTVYNALVVTYNAHLISPTAHPEIFASGASAAAPFIGMPLPLAPLAPTLITDIEDTTITH